MFVKTPPMGWNSWNTFGENIDEKLIMQTADRMAEDGYLAKGYQYLIIDDCWSLRRRGEDGKLHEDPVKFPHGMKYVADYVHKKGLKFGMYSCAGLMTCAGYPSSYDHEYEDAQTFADWGVDYLKYDFCNFPKHDSGPVRYRTMAMALRATGRDILFAACNWGVGESWKWMRAAGAHTYRSTGDIFDSFRSAFNIASSQADLLLASAPDCFNDMDMLTVGMYGKGNVGYSGDDDRNRPTDRDYETQFALWAAFGSPLIIGGDLRSMNPFCRSLLQNERLIAVNQDPACRAPIVLHNQDDALVFARHMSDDTIVIGLTNGREDATRLDCYFKEFGLPFTAPYALELTDVISGEEIGRYDDYYTENIPAHGIRLMRGRIVSK